MELRSQLPTYNHEFCQTDKVKLWRKAIQQLNRPVTIQLLLPPPNITGQLHLGHAWNGFLQDFFVRYQLLCGQGVRWLAGVDHAGIATQIKISKRLTDDQSLLPIRTRSITNRQLLTAIWAHRSRSETIISHQLQQLGLLIDPIMKEAPLTFTLDDQFTTAVNTMFVKLYQDGLIYQGYRIVMWDSALKTAVSNIEINFENRHQKLYYFKYRAFDCDSEFLVVATSRPETMFADQALVVNDQDARFLTWINRMVVNPANGQKIPVIGDHAVDANFGSGVMKCTPGHDQLDFEIGRRHHLAQSVCIDVKTGLINHHGGQYAGLDPISCRTKLVGELQRQGRLIKTEQYQASVPISCRTQTVAEPILSRQWFVKTQPLAKLVKKWQLSIKKTTFVPTRFEVVLTKWMNEVEDWCISRQIIWGHRLPVWKNWVNPEKIYVGLTPPHDSAHMQQVTDVFDTWFSSALCFLVANGWPMTPVKRWQPITMLVTGYDIIFFWVARMLMFSLYVARQGLVQTVLVHGLVRDHSGRKMSKSLNNGIDPLIIIKQYGVDSLRLFLITNTAPGLDIKFNPSKLKAGVSFLLKLWNVARYVLTRLTTLPAWDWVTLKKVLINHSGTFDHIWNEWITACWLQVRNKFHFHVRRFEYGLAFFELRRWLINDFCAWYLEVSKLVNNQITNAICSFCLIDYLRALYPFAPFISETLFGLLTQKRSIISERYDLNPSSKSLLFSTSVHLVEVIRAVINALRQWRAQLKIAPHQIVRFTIKFNEGQSALNRELVMMNPVFAKLVQAQFDSALAPTAHRASITLRYGRILLATQQAVDWDRVLIAKNKQLLRLQSLLLHTETLVNNVAFLTKAKRSKVNDMLERKESLMTQIKQIKSQIVQIKTKMNAKDNN